MSETEMFYRDKVLGFRQKSLPANTYRSVKALLASSDRDCVFVPLRSMQYMAVIDKDEIIFVDAISARRSIEFSWCEFHPQSRDSLEQAVNYKLVYYDNKALETVKRAQVEFDSAVQLLYLRNKKLRNNNMAEIVEFTKK